REALWGAGHRLDSERFRTGPRTFRPLYGRLTVRQTERQSSLVIGAPVATPDDRGGTPHVRHDTARVQHAGRRRGGCVAARGAGAAAGDPDRRPCAPPTAPGPLAPSRGVPHSPPTTPLAA